MSVSLNDVQLGPLPIGENASASFGPVSAPLPEQVTVVRRLNEDEEKSQQVELSGKPPFTFYAIKFYIDENGALHVSFVIRVGGWRNVEIPLNEASTAAAQRQLNETLHIAAGRGKLEIVKDAVEKGADVNYLFDTIYPSPVRYAANGRHKEVMNFLLARGARVRKRDLDALMLQERMKELRREAE